MHACVQEKSYFALALPHGWWLFGIDLALVDDIDICQCRCVMSTCPQQHKSCHWPGQQMYQQHLTSSHAVSMCCAVGT